MTDKEAEKEMGEAIFKADKVRLGLAYKMRDMLVEYSRCIQIDPKDKYLLDFINYNDESMGWDLENNEDTMYEIEEIYYKYFHKK